MEDDIIQELERLYGPHCVNCFGLANAYHHLVPRSLGGKDCVDNLVPLCVDCHRWADMYPEHWEPVLREKAEKIRRMRNEPS